MKSSSEQATLREPWPRWPQPHPETAESVLAVLDSGVWAISSRSSGEPLQCELFRSDFARFVKRSWCVEVDHGTSALVTAFEALGIGPGDEVIVPTLTWVSCASSVLRVGAKPVLVDVDPKTLAVSVDTIRRSVTDRTACILVVHLNATAADIGPIVEFARARGVAVVEDCAQAQGGEWIGGVPLGSHGDLAVFSFQASKSLAGGEGGAVVGDDDTLRRRVESARADSRELQVERAPAGEMHLQETGVLLGSNYCMPEVTAAILRVALSHFPAQIEYQQSNAELLDGLFQAAGFEVVEANPHLSVRPAYEYSVYLDFDGWKGNDRIHREAREALTVATGTPVYEIDAPLHRSPLYYPESQGRYSDQISSTDPTNFPTANDAYERLAQIHHSVLLAPSRRMRELVEAFEQVRDGAALKAGSSFQ